MATYTEEQIQHVCDAGYDIMGKYVDVQTCMFPSTVIRKGMEDGLSADEIADKAYHAVAHMPVFRYNLVGASSNIDNIARYMANEVKHRIEEL